MLVVERSLLTRYSQVRKRSEQICAPLAVEDYVVQPVAEVSPPKWHLGHTTWFFESFILQPNKPGYTAYNDSFPYVFNSYYESMGARVIRTDRGNLTRPSVEEVLAYRSYVDREMAAFLEEEPSEEVRTLLELGLNHEEQHQELLLYDIKYILGNNPLFPSYRARIDRESRSARPMGWLKVGEGLHRIGFSGDGFSFDNEHGSHEVFLHAAQISDRLVTNAEFLQFMEDGGYGDFRHWLADGWDWVRSNNVKAPFHWHHTDGRWMQYTLNGGLQPVDPDAAVCHVSYYEADAFAKWAGLRLPTEFEWEVACRAHGDRDNGNFLENDSLEPRAAKEGHYQFYGDVWEWTSSAYLPYPYYKAPEGAVGEYNGKFMVNQMVLRGGSCATPSGHIRPTYRNFFQPNHRWLFSGFRLAKYD